MEVQTVNNDAAIGSNNNLYHFLDLICCPQTKDSLTLESNFLQAQSSNSYNITPVGIPLFAEKFISPEAKAQEEHFNTHTKQYMENLTYPHTQEYMNYLNKVFLDIVEPNKLTTIAELCCGHGEALDLLQTSMANKIERAIGVDVSIKMLNEAAINFSSEKFAFLQGDATQLPIKDNSMDSVFMLGGIHHVPQREKLFAEVHRILKPGGIFYWREPVDDFFLWRWIRLAVYRLSPSLDHINEKPLRFKETAQSINNASLKMNYWKTYGFIGFCLFMNSDILLFNRLFRFLPGIKTITKMFIGLDHITSKIIGFRFKGLQVVGKAVKT